MSDAGKAQKDEGLDQLELVLRGPINSQQSTGGLFAEMPSASSRMREDERSNEERLFLLAFKPHPHLITPASQVPVSGSFLVSSNSQVTHRVNVFPISRLGMPLESPAYA
ncbi:MAG: hypothetical protein Q9206_005484 [Seirophora lacunosa]